MFYSMRGVAKASTTAALLAATAALFAVQPARAGTWQVTVTSTNSSPTPTNDASVAASASSNQTMAMAMVGASGTSASGVSGSATASYTGTWTFTWVPDNGSDWPSAYTITSLSTRMFSASIVNGSSTASVDTCSITLPGSPTAQGTGVPVLTTTTDTTDANLTITTRDSLTGQYDHAITGGWASEKSDSKIVTRAYTAAYFPAHFATPSAVVLTFNVSGGGATASVSSYTSTNSNSAATAMMAAADTFSGQ